jgi:predicted alpha/beta superfamily hydrolase
LAACTPVSTVSSRFESLPALRGDYFPITARTNNRQYHIHVRLPEGYDPAQAATYPVVYILDGDSLFPLLAPTHLFLHYDEKLPEAILVGIAYGGFDPAINKRHVDFSAPGSDALPDQQGAPQFLGFLKAQLLPEIERRYRTDAGKRILIGQSRAGYFVLWSAVQQPGLFWASIASNAAFAPAREKLYEAAARPASGASRVAVVSGTRDTDARMQSAVEWTRYWQAQPAAPWEVRHFVLQDGTHAASIGQAYREVMVWLFK